MSLNRTNQTTPWKKIITLATTAAISVIAIILLGVMTAQAQSGTVPNPELSSASPGELTITWNAPDPGSLGLPDCLGQTGPGLPLVQSRQ